MKKRIMADKFLWVDLEMTGLDPDMQCITEIALIVTDVDLNELATYESFVHQSDAKLRKAEPWVKENMQEVLEGSRQEKKTIRQVEAEILDIIDEHFDEMVVLAGNSIHQDRRFIRRQMPKLEARLHYRMLDVSAWKVYMMAKFGIEMTKANQHRALEDIRGSIAELRQYLDFFGK